jgi:hypothetical protein
MAITLDGTDGVTTTGLTSNGIDDNATSTAVTINSSGTVGIGTTTPNAAYALDVVGSIRATNSAGSTIVVNRTSNPGSVEFQYSGTQTAQFSALSGGGVATYVGSTPTEVMRIDASGNVGIGTSSPLLDFVVSNNGAQGFEVNASGIISGGVDVLSYNRSTSAYAPIYNNASYYVWATSTTERMRIDASGNVGIGTGTPTPAGLLYLKFFGTTNGLYLQNTSGAVEYASFTANPATGEVRIGGTNAGAGAYFPTFYSNGLERMRLDSSGNLMIGRTNTSFGAGTAGLFITSTGRLLNEVSGDSTLALNRTDGTGTTNIVSFYRGNIYAGAIQTAASGTPSFTSASDARLKNNIVSHESELANVMSLRPTRWDWKNESLGSGEGFIAQDLEQTAWSDLVSEGDDGYKQVAGLGVVETRLIKAIQEQQAMIEELKAEVAALKGA